MTATVQREELAALLEYVADGAWHDGLTVLREIQRVIPPGIASRVGEARLKNPERYTLEEKVRMGSRARAREAIAGQIAIGRLEIAEPAYENGTSTPLSKLTRDHWSGVKPFLIRDTEAGLVSVDAMADELDLARHVVRKWVENGFVPHIKNRTGLIRFTREQQEIVRRVAPYYPGPGKIRWEVNPKSLWTTKESAVTVTCPHCDNKVTVTLGVAD